MRLGAIIKLFTHTHTHTHARTHTHTHICQQMFNCMLYGSKRLLGKSLIYEKLTMSMRFTKILKVKRLRNSGLEYTSSRGVRRRARAIDPGCGIQCAKKCHSKISAAFHSFWQMGDVQRQRDFIVQHCKRSNKIRGNKEARRSKITSTHSQSMPQ